jgi:HPt (histidine-containing phosphotransfer) domain-containing protein
MTLEACYANLGGDYKDVMSRLMTEARVTKFALRFLDDPSYQLLTQSLEAENWDEAFRAAHTIKGVCQNLSFTSLGNAAEALTEALRPGSEGSRAQADLPALTAKLDRAYETTVSALHALAS